ncbi:hypothetical protein, partial [Methanohalobium sp.]|uniref:hypothetical protein n=1 Tax=Methanohalobium sp. TaxID=2837493 RepID=UPI0025D0DB3E
MKFNFKKISAVVAGALMTGMAMGGAVSAASYPAPFVEDGVASSNAIVYGSDAMDQDQVVSGNLQSDLDSYIESTSSSSSGLGEEYELIEGTGNSLTLGESLSDVDTKFGADELPTILADGTLEDQSVDYGETEEIDYDQELSLSSHFVEYSSLSDEEDYAVNTDAASDQMPVLNIDQSSGDAYSLTVDFTSAINATAYDDSEAFTVAGKDLTFDPQMSSDELVLFEATETVSIDAGESKTIDGDTVEVTGANTDASPATATLIINGEKYQVEAGDKEEGFYVSDIFVQTIPEKTASVKLFAGSKKWVLDTLDGTRGDIEVDGTTMEGVQASVSAGSNNTETINSITFHAQPYDLEADEKDYLEIGEELEDPLFGSFKMLFDSVEPEMKADTKGKVSLTGGDTVEISFTSRNGNEYSISPMEINSSGDAVIAGENWYTDKVNGTLSHVTKDSIFITNEGTGSAEETLIYQITKIDDGDSGSNGDEEVVFEELSSGSSVVVSDEEELGDTDLYVPDLPQGVASDATFALRDGGPAAANASVKTDLFTEEGMSIEIPFLTSSSTVINMTEDREGEFNLDSEGITPATLDVNVSADSSDEVLELRTMPGANFSDVSVSDTDTEYGLSDFGTYYEADTDAYSSVELWLPTEDLTTYNVYFSSTGGTSDSGSGIGDILVTDSEVDSVSDKNLIVVGGSCVNTAAADLLGVDYKTCGEDFTEATDIGSGQALIEGYSDSDLTSKQAVLVAGYSATDTSNAAQYLMNEKPDTSQAHKV